MLFGICRSVLQLLQSVTIASPSTMVTMVTSPAAAAAKRQQRAFHFSLLVELRRGVLSHWWVLGHWCLATGAWPLVLSATLVGCYSMLHHRRYLAVRREIYAGESTPGTQPGTQPAVHWTHHAPIPVRQKRKKLWVYSICYVNSGRWYHTW